MTTGEYDDHCDNDDGSQGGADNNEIPTWHLVHLHAANSTRSIYAGSQ